MVKLKNFTATVRLASRVHGPSGSSLLDWALVSTATVWVGLRHPAESFQSVHLGTRWTNLSANSRGLLASLTASAGGSRYHLYRDHLQQAVAPYKGLFCSGWEEARTLTEDLGRAALRRKISSLRCIKVLHVVSGHHSYLTRTRYSHGKQANGVGGVKSLGQSWYKGKSQTCCRRKVWRTNEGALKYLETF